MSFVTIDTYNNSFQVSEDWLLANTDVQTVGDFLDTYTWDEGEWLYIQYSIEQEEKEINHLTVLLKQGYSLFKKKNQEGILHANSKDKGYQFSYFDQYGAIGDIQENTLEDMAKKIHEYGFRLCHKEEINIIK